MKTLTWLVLTCILFPSAVVQSSWTALHKLNSNLESRTIDASPDGAMLNGIQVAVAEQIAAIVTQMLNRAFFVSATATYFCTSKY